MNALRSSLLMLALMLTACGPADAYLDGEGEVMDAETEQALNSGRFETFQGKDGQYYFHLLAGNGEKILASEGYTTLSSAKSGIETVKKNGLNPMRFLQREAVDGRAYFVLTGGNGAIIGVSQMYATASNANRGAATVQQVIAQVVATTAAQPGDTKFETFRGLDRKYYFHLKANNGQIVLQSQGYTSRSGATSGIASVKTNGANPSRFEIREARDGRHYFVLKAGNGAVVGVSEMYETKANAERGTAVVQGLLVEAK